MPNKIVDFGRSIGKTYWATPWDYLEEAGAFELPFLDLEGNSVVAAARDAASTYELQRFRDWKTATSTSRWSHGYSCSTRPPFCTCPMT